MTQPLAGLPALTGRVLLSQMISINAESTLLLDPQLRILTFNSAVQALRGSAAEILLGQNISMLVHPDDQVTLTHFLQRSTNDFSGEGQRIRVRQANGAWLWVRASARSFLDDPNVQALALHLHPEGLQAHHHGALQEITRALNSTDPFPAILGRVLAQGVRAVGAKAASVFVLSEDGQQLELTGETGFSTQVVTQWARVPISLDTPVTNVVRDRKPLFLNSQAYRAQYFHLPPAFSGAAPSLVALPLIAGDHLLGVLALFFPHDHLSGDQERAFLQLVAELCAPALDRNRIAQELKREQDWSRTVNLNSSDIASILDDQGFIRYESGAIERLLGYAATELIGQSISTLIHPDDLARVQQTLATLHPGGTPVKITLRCQHRDGQWVWLESIAVDLHAHPHVGGVLVNSRDVSAREEARLVQEDILDRLTVSERNFKRLADHASDLVRQYALDGTVVYASPTSRDLLGYDSEELLGPDPLHHVHEDDLPALQEAFQRRLTPTFEQEKFEYRLRRRDGTYLWVETVFKAIRDPHTQEVTAFIDTSRDIDQRKQAEQHLNVQLNRYNQLLDFTASLEQLRDPAALTAEALHKCLELTEYDYGYAFAWSPTELTFESQAGLTSAAISDFMDELRLHTFVPVVRQAIGRGEAYFAVDDEPLLDPGETLPRVHWRSLCVLPVLRQGTLMSVLVWCSARARVLPRARTPASSCRMSLLA